MDEMRRKREATTVQIRKEKKEDSLQKRRRDVGGGGGSSGASRSSSGGDTRTAGEGGRASSHTANAPDPSLKAKLDALPEDCERCGTPSEQLEATSVCKLRR